MTIDLDKLEAVARAATPGEWTEVGMSASRVGTTQYGENMTRRLANVHKDTDLAHITTFDPPTVLALIRRIHELEGNRSTCPECTREVNHEGWNTQTGVIQSLWYCPECRLEIQK